MGQKQVEAPEGETTGDPPTHSVRTLNPGLSHSVTSPDPTSPRPQRIKTMVLHSGNPKTQRGLQVARSHTDKGLLSTAVLLLPAVSSGTGVLLHRGLLDA